jgi:hypothetical protein
MSIEELLAEAVAARMTLKADGERLAVRGDQSLERLVRRVLVREAEVMTALAEARQTLQRLDDEGRAVIAIGHARIRVTPPLPAARRGEVTGKKQALIAVLRSETDPGVQAICDRIP